MLNPNQHNCNYEALLLCCDDALAIAITSPSSPILLMARASGRLVIHGTPSETKLSRMFVEFSDAAVPPVRIRDGGFFAGHDSIAALKAHMQGQATHAATNVDELPTFESQSSTESHRKHAVLEEEEKEDAVKDQSDRREVAAGGFQKRKMFVEKKVVRAVGRAPASARGYGDSNDEEEVKVTQLDEYDILDADNNSVSVLELPLCHKTHEIGGSLGVKELHIRGKANGDRIMRSITGWKLVLRTDRPFYLSLRSMVGSRICW